jgi:hypothetical protein
LIQLFLLEEEGSEEALPLPEDALILHLIATGLLQLAKRIERTRTLNAPYPPALQKGWDRLNMLCYRNQHPLVHTLADLLQLCRQSMKTWTLQYNLADLDDDDTLLTDDEFPTGICQSLACVSADVEAELREQHFIDAVFQICKPRLPDSYVAFRRLFIEHPVLTAFQFHEKFEMTPALRPLKNLLKNAYDEAPLEYLYQDQFYGCPHCGHLMLPHEPRRRLVCENERCRRNPAIQSPIIYPSDQDVLWLRREFRLFISRPGLAEIRLAQQLRDLGLRVELWPNFDACDLHVFFPNGTYWAIDVKDWASPFLMAFRVDPIPQGPQCERAYFAFPNERRLLQGNYVQAFCTTCNSRFQEGKGTVCIDGQKMRAAFDSDLVTDARQYLVGGRHA